MYDDRLERLERRTDDLSHRLRRLEQALPAPVPPITGSSPRAASSPSSSPPPASPAPSRLESPPRPGSAARSSFEDLLGGRVLAWAGGVAVLVGLVLLAAVAVSNGWLGEGGRTAFAGLLSVALLGLGVRLHERRGRTDAARAAAAAGVAGLFVTAVLGARVYDVVPLTAGIALAAIAGMLGVVLALRWEGRGLAGLGLLGALAAPAALGANDTGTIVLLWIMAAAAAALLVARGWQWLALSVYATVTPQWLLWLAHDERGLAATLAALLAFGVPALVTGVGFEIRAGSRSLRPGGAFVVALNAAVLAAVGWFALRAAASEGVADGWLVALAAAHVLASVATARGRRVSTELTTLLATIAAVLADVAAASLVHGPALPAVWVAGALLAAVIARTVRGRPPAAGDVGEGPLDAPGVPIRVADLGVGAHVALAVGHALTTEAPPGSAGLGIASTGVLLIVAAACLAAGRVAGWGLRARFALDLVGLAAMSYLLASQLDGAALAVAWAGQAVALAAVARRTREPSAAWGAIGTLLLAGAHASAIEAPPAALVDGLSGRLAALAALTAFAAGAVALARTRRVVGTVAGWTGLEPAHVAGALLGASALAVLHLASTELVTATLTPGAGFLDARERSQMLLSALWALAGTAALVVGLRRDLRPVRLGGLGLLLVAAAKVFVFDLAALDSGWRVGSFLVLGLLLLGGAFAWQRLRPRPAPDLRRTPAALR